MGWWAGGRAIWANGRVALFSSKHVEVSNERIIQTCSIDLPSTRVDVSSDSMMPSTGSNFALEFLEFRELLGHLRIFRILGIFRNSWEFLDL